MKGRKGGGGGGMKPPRKTDKKGSRAMTYENESMRMRSMDISAEIDRGQSDMRKLKRENETLKQQVWTLRDEYDKLETLVKEMEDEDEEDDDDEEEEEEDDDDDDDDDEEEEEDSQKIQKNESKVNKEIENVQKIYSGQVQSVEYMVQQGSEMNRNVRHMHPMACGAPKINQPLCPQLLPMQSKSTDAPLVITPVSTEIASHSNSEPSTSQNDSYLTAADHFNLDQLLDFASSFHFDRRKHLTDDDSSITVTTIPNVLSKEKETCSIAEEDESDCKDEKVSSPSSSSHSGTLRRRSSTVIEKLKGSSSSALLKEVKQVSLCKDGAMTSGLAITETPEVSNETTTVSYSRSSYYFAGSLDGRSQSLGGGLNNTTSTARTPVSPDAPLYSSSSASNIASGTTCSSIDSNLPLVSVYSKRTPSMVRLSSIEPNTVMISVSEMPQLWDICTQEIIDELEQQVSSTMPDIRGVRVTSRAAYICLGHRESLERLMECGLTVRGILVPLIDITHESIVVALTGVPHYIADATLSILLSAFGVIIGEIERRFYKGVDTGERFVRLKLKKHVKLPKYVTVGGCRIVLGIHGVERHTPQIQEWNPLSNTVPPPTPHTIPRETIPDFPPPLSAETGPCLSHVDPSETVRFGSGSTNGEVHYHKKPERRSSITSGPRTFASRCVVNLKVPDRQCLSASGPRIAHREAPLPPGTSGISSSINAGHVLRAGSLGRNSRSNSEDLSKTNLAVPQVNIKSPILNRRNIVDADIKIKDQPRSRPASVAFEDVPRESQIRPPPPVPQVPLHTFCPTPLANGILRKPSTVSNSEQEALLPGQQKQTATIRNRLKIGRSSSTNVEADAAATAAAVKAKSKTKKPEPSEKKVKKKKKKKGSVNENDNYEDSSDVTPLGASSRPRRDSDKSSNGKNKPKKEVIDLPWCGCWGNGCF